MNFKEVSNRINFYFVWLRNRISSCKCFGIFRILSCIITVRNVVAARYYFHKPLSFCLGRHPPGQTPPRHPWADTPHPGQTPPPPGRHPLPLGRHPPGQTPPPSACWDTHPPTQCMLGYTPLPAATAADGTHPTGMQCIHFMNLIMFVFDYSDHLNSTRDMKESLNDMHHRISRFRLQSQKRK